MLVTRRLLPVILLLTAVAWLALRVLVAVQLQAADPTRLYQPDSATYEQSALAMLQAGRFSEAPDRLDRPQITRTPGYPLLIAVVYAIAGPRPMAVVVVQLALALVTALLTGLIARELMLECDLSRAGRAQAWSTGLALLDPVSFNYTYKLLTETLAAFCTALLVWLLLAGARRLRESVATLRLAPLGWGAAAGSLVAVGMFVRPIGFLLGPPLALWALWALTRARVPRGRRLISCALLLAIWATAYTCWCARNERVSGWWGFSAISSYNLLYYRAGGAVAWREGIPVADVQRRMAEQYAGLETLPAAERVAGYIAAARSYFEADPVALMRAQLHGLRRLWRDAGDDHLWSLFGGTLGDSPVLSELTSRGLWGFWREWVPYNRGWFACWALCFTIMWVGYLGALWGSVRLLRRDGRRNPALWLVIGAVAYFTILSAGAEAYARFRVPYLPCLLALAGCGWAWLPSEKTCAPRDAEVGASTL